ncbi:hypothetical protein ARMGADRAFT_1087438 [Armillaria gallica]|uniref:G-protein coupled receptors family 1 profile domain-containing protein n=1 Tax=Armillaria gallica TaxID=47427 RepID=A0A2H3D919_ARMGA|nr:hypothetical protein ARMGADRAFT_1087438 [Armillaria gallica]
MALSNFKLALTLSNFVGSGLSVLGSGFIILCYVFLPLKKHYRHFLILNLAIADVHETRPYFINAMDNVVSGVVVLTTGPLSRTPACIANGFIEQLSVQATDTSIFAISIVTIMIVTASNGSSWSVKSKKNKERFITVVCGCTWVLPILTSFIALGKDYYTAVSGNWCWLTPEPVYVRYVLTHGWRIMFIFIEIGLYMYLYVHLRRRVKDLNIGLPWITTCSGMNLRNGFDDLERSSEIHAPPINITCSQSLKPSFETQYHPSSVITFHPHYRQKHLSKILLLNAYPIAYIVLWIPGLCNRLVEASGHTSRVLQILQASTQFVGFANALTYGWNERVAKSVSHRDLGSIVVTLYLGISRMSMS